jgi:hypothetical protein
MDSHRRRLPIAAIVLVDARPSSGLWQMSCVTPSEADDSCEDGFDR